MFELFPNETRKKEPDELVEIIMYQILPKVLVLEENEHPFWSIFDYELQCLALKKIKYKKCYFDYQMEKKKTVKNA